MTKWYYEPGASPCTRLKWLVAIGIVLFAIVLFAIVFMEIGT